MSEKRYIDEELKEHARGIMQYRVDKIIEWEDMYGGSLADDRPGTEYSVRRNRFKESASDVEDILGSKEIERYLRQLREHKEKVNSGR